MKLFKGLINVSILLALIVIVLGAYTRLTDAGLGCPDWPGCYGSLQIPHNQEHIAAAQARFPEAQLVPHKARNEMVHRYVAATLGLCVVAIFFCSLWLKQQRGLSSGLLLLVIIQAALGMWTVTLSLLPFVVVAHLLGGFSLFALLVILRQGFAASAEQTSAGPTHSAWLLNGDLVNLRPLAKLGLVVLLIQILLGGWTSANYAALVCHQLPLCEAGWQERFSLSAAMHLPLHHETYEYGVMPYEARMTIHVMHRMGALLSLLVLGSFAFLAWQGSQQAGARKLAILLAGLLLTQICLGLINVIAQLPLLNAVAHNFVAANLFAVMLLWVYLLHRQPTAQSLVATNTMQLLGGRYGNE